MPIAATDRLSGGVGQIGVLVGDGGDPPLDRLVDHVDEPDRFTAPAAQPLAVRSQHQPERHVLGAGRWDQPPGHPADGEDHLQVLALLGTDDVEQACRSASLDAVDDAGQVARAVGERPGRAAHDQRQRLALPVREAGWEHDQRAVGLLQQAGRIEPVDHLRHQRLVAALAGEVVVGQQHAELGVDLVPVLCALGYQVPPQPHRLLVALLQQHDPGPGPLAGTPRQSRASSSPPCRRRPGHRGRASPRPRCRRGARSACRTAGPNRRCGSRARRRGRRPRAAARARRR